MKKRCRWRRRGKCTRFSKSAKCLIKRLMRKNFFVNLTPTVRNPTLGGDKVRTLVAKSRYRMHDTESELIRDFPFYRISPD